MAYNCTRRTALAAMAVSSLQASGSPNPRLGGPLFLKSEDPGELAQEHRRLGYSAAYCPKAQASDTARVKEIERAFNAKDVVIAEVGAWSNMLEPDAEKRKAVMRNVVERMALAEAVGARCCVNIAGSYNPTVWYGPHPDNLSRKFFDATVENCRLVLDEIKPRRAKFALEMMGWCLPDSPDSYLNLVKAVDRKQFGVHIDVCNGINSPSRFYGNAAFITECFRKLGPWIVSCHAKDLNWLPEMNVHFVEVVPGRGKVDYRAYLRAIAGLGRDVPLMIEHLKTPEEFEEGKRYIQGIATSLGIRFA